MIEVEHGSLSMRSEKFSRRSGKMDAAIFVDSAAEMAGKLVAREMRGPGDIPNAMRRIEARYGVPAETLRSLRYQKPKTILAHVYARIAAAYEAEIERQHRLLDHERSITKAKNGFAAALVRTADALARKED